MELCLECLDWCEPEYLEGVVCESCYANGYPYYDDPEDDEDWDFDFDFGVYDYLDDPIWRSDDVA